MLLRRLLPVFGLSLAMTLEVKAEASPSVTDVQFSSTSAVDLQIAQTERITPRINPPIPTPPLPSEPLPTLPSPDELLQPPSPISPQNLPDVPTTVFIERFQVEGSTVFSPEELATVAKQAVVDNVLNETGYNAENSIGTETQIQTETNIETNIEIDTETNAQASEESDSECPVPKTIDVEVNRELTFAEVLRARSAITQLYIQCGYVTSGALIPPQALEGNVVKIQVVEGSLAEINVSGTRRLNRSYVSSRLNLAASRPLNVTRLLEGLQLLKLDPLIATISADLQAGIRPGTSILQVTVTEADTFSITPSINNGRSPSVGSFQRQLTINQANLTGLGDGLSVSYANTDGSNEVDASYAIPVNPRNGTVQLNFGISKSRVIEEPFDELEIESTSSYYELSYRQPVILTPVEELALGLTASYQESKAEYTPFGIEPTLAFPALGADEDGRTRISAVRLFQNYTQRSSQHVLAFRSQFSLGLDVLDASMSDTEPDSRFFAWRGQGQWVRLLAPDMLFLLRGDAQLTGDALLPLEQFGLGGQNSVRGYRQDALLTDNGALLSAELRLPILRIRNVDTLLQVAPFVDVGTAWNNQLTNPDPSTLVGVGLGLILQIGDNFYTRLDYGVPIISVDSQKQTWQENGIYFSVNFTPF